ncbi:unnamed protein product, partial [Trichogramma brassicae]
MLSCVINIHTYTLFLTGSYNPISALDGDRSVAVQSAARGIRRALTTFSSRIAYYVLWPRRYALYTCFPDPSPARYTYHVYLYSRECLSRSLTLFFNSFTKFSRRGGAHWLASQRAHARQPPLLYGETAPRSIAGMCSKTAVAPLDRIKILLQAHNNHYKHLGTDNTRV